MIYLSKLREHVSRDCYENSTSRELSLFFAFQVDIYAGFLHDAVLLYAFAVHDVLQREGNFTDGRVLVKHMINRSFEGLYLY